MVHVRVEFSSGGCHFPSTVYTKCTRVSRRPLWQAFESVVVGGQGPWMAVGDFNVVSSIEERSGGSLATVTNIEEFNSAMFRCGLSSV